MEVSVIVPTYNRKETLLPLLESLLAQVLPSGAFEVIVSCDGSTDGTIERVEQLCCEQATREGRTERGESPTLRLLVQQQGGPAAARNRGAAEAKGRFLAFTDDDCLAMPGWLAAVIAPFKDTAVVAVQGRTMTTPEEVTPLTHQVVSQGSSAMPTCNAACRREVFERLGGFYEGFPFAHNEDADLAWRLEKIGRIHYAPEALILHPPRAESFKKKVRWVRYFESEFPLWRRHPETYQKYRSSSPWGTIYWNVFVLGQFRQLKSNCRFLVRPFKPSYFILGFGIVFARWFQLLFLLPHFIRASRRYRTSTVEVSM